MPLDAIFSFANLLALFGWLVLLGSPWLPERARIVPQIGVPALLALAYGAVLFGGAMPEGGGFGSLDGVAVLFSSRSVLLAGWLHFLAFDLFVGAWMVNEARRCGLAFPFAVPCLALAFMLGPLGFLLFLVLRGLFARPAEGDLTMTAITADRPLSLPLLSEFGRREPVLAISGLVLLLALAPLGFAGITDARLVDGAPVWGKPFRFALALGVYLLTLAFFAGWMAPDARRSRLMRWTVWVGVAAIGFEQFWITWQAAHGEASHWNMSSPLAAAMWALMGVSAVILTLMAPVIGWLVWRRPLPDLAPVLRLGAVLGLVLTFPLTLLTAGTMAAHGAHLVGGTGAGEALWFMGWSREVGDLRVGHFFATHALQALPLAAAGMMALGLPRDRLGPVFGIAALYCGFVVFTFVQALMGQPFV